MERASAPEPGQAELRALAEAASEGLLLARAGRVAWANAALAGLASVDAPDTLAGHPVGELLEGAPASPESGAAVVCALRRPDGSVRAVSVQSLPCGENDAAAYAVRDLEPLGALGDELAAAGRALREAEEALASLRERLRRELAEREELLTVVSHELRTPVTVITGYNRLLLAEKVGPLGDEQRRFLHESNKSCRRLNDFIANLLELARESRGELHVQPCSASLDATVRGVVRFLEPLLEEHDLRIDVRLDPKATDAWFDPIRIEQVLTNLIGNAIKYARPRGRVVVAARPVACGGERFVEVSVSDDGEGVLEADRSRIFDPYVRAGSGRKAGGLGLGLAICKHIIEAHDGEIHVGEAEGGGARFAFSLRAEPPAPVATGTVSRDG